MRARSWAAKACAATTPRVSAMVQRTARSMRHPFPVEVSRLYPACEPPEVVRGVDIGEALDGPIEVPRAGAVTLHHGFATPFARPGEQLVEQGAAEQQRRRRDL